MSRRRSKSSSFLTILILVAAISLWAYDSYKQGQAAKEKDRPIVIREVKAKPASSPPATKSTQKSSAQVTQTGKYETYHSCTLVPDRGNDGDSFKIKLPNGRTEIVRLYFVDAPESAFKTYGGGQNNHKRIQQQADAMGGISPQQAVEIGKKSKDFTLAHLEKSPFTIHTEWDSPFNDQRYHAFIEISFNSKTRFLHELLVEKGYARIHTKGAPLPDGTSQRKQQDHLRTLERTAKSSEAGVWGL